MSEATETILSEAKKRVEEIHAALAELANQKAPLDDELKQMMDVIKSIEPKSKSNRGRPKKDKTEEVKNVLRETGPLSLTAIAERVGMRTSVVNGIVRNGDFVGTIDDGGNDTVWALANG